jgi:hypothetical protein
MQQELGYRAPDKLRICVFFICNIECDWMIYRKHPIRSLLTSMLRKANIRYPLDVYALSFEKYKVSSVSSDSIVKGIIDDIIKTTVKTAEVDEQKTKRKHEKVISRLYEVNTEQNIYNILLINMTQSCQIKQIYIELQISCVFA